MATVSGGTTTITVTEGSNDANGAAALVTNAISSALAAGRLVQVAAPGTNPTVGAGLFNATASSPSTITLGAAVPGLVVSDGTPGGSIILGSGGQGQLVVVGNTTVGYNTGGGSGMYVSSDASQLFAIPTVGGGSFVVTEGAGNDINVLGSGMNTVNAGAGTNADFTGGSSDVINSAGNDIINGATGGRNGQIDTVNAGGAGTSTFIAEGAKGLLFNGGAGSTVILQGIGTDTINLGSGGGIVAGGTFGRNMITTGTSGNATIFGGGGGDVLTAQGSGNNLIAAGPGNETLTGATSTGNNIFFAGPGNDVITDGSGNDVVFAGTGSSTINGGSGTDLFAIVAGRAGGSVVINNFTAKDAVTLQGYGSGELTTDLAKVPAGSSTLTLSDNTKITFTGLTPSSIKFV